MRIFPHALFLLLAAGLGCAAQEKKDEPKKPKFAIGDPAPPLAGAKWLQGKEVKFEKDKVYVVEFWATWCAPCIKMMPHLAKLQEDFGKQGLQIVAVTTADEDGNSLEEVQKFVKMRGSKLPFPFAFGETDALKNAYREDAGFDGLPASFVIDQAGKLAFVGHPGDLDDVLPRVLAKDWKGQASIDEIEKEKNELDDILNLIQDAAQRAERANQGKGSDAITKAVGNAAAEASAEALRLLPAYEKKWPYKAKQPIFDAVRLAVTLQAREYDAGAKLTETLLKKAIEAKDADTLDRIRSFWSAKALNPDRKSVAFAVTAAEETIKIQGESDLMIVLGAAEAYYAAGNKAKGDEYGAKAKKIVGDDGKAMAAVEKALKRYQE